jgi:thiamine-phosphate diphosphorylase
MSLRENFDLSVYFVVGPENVPPGQFRDVVRAAIAGGITFLQVRSKVAGGKELYDLTKLAAEEIATAQKSESLALVIDDRVDVVAALRLDGVKVDGVHVGQSDLPVASARKILGPDAIVGLSAPAAGIREYIANYAPGVVDYFGAGPLRPTATKPDCGLVDGQVVQRSLEEIADLAQISPLPLVIGGGVGVADLPGLKATKVDGFFVVSAIASAPDPLAATRQLAQTWATAP